MADTRTVLIFGGSTSGLPGVHHSWLSARAEPTQLPGMMTRRELADSYLEQAGLPATPFDFYYVYGLFRLAVIVQQIYYRFVHGQTTNPRFAPFGQFCTVLSRRAQSVAAGQARL